MFCGACDMAFLQENLPDYLSHKTLDLADVIITNITVPKT